MSSFSDDSDLSDDDIRVAKSHSKPHNKSEHKSEHRHVDRTVVNVTQLQPPCVQRPILTPEEYKNIESMKECEDYLMGDMGIDNPINIIKYGSNKLPKPDVICQEEARLEAEKLARYAVPIKPLDLNVCKPECGIANSPYLLRTSLQPAIDMLSNSLESGNCGAFVNPLGASPSFSTNPNLAQGLLEPHHTDGLMPPSNFPNPTVIGPPIARSPPTLPHLSAPPVPSKPAVVVVAAKPKTINLDLGSGRLHQLLAEHEVIIVANKTAVMKPNGFKIMLPTSVSDGKTVTITNNSINPVLVKADGGFTGKSGGILIKGQAMTKFTYYGATGWVKS